MSDKEQINIPPIGGWESNTWYVVEVSYRDDNPIHKALLFTGFLSEEGIPSGHNIIVNGGYRDTNPLQFHKARFIRAIKRLYEQEIPVVGDGNAYKLPTSPDLEIDQLFLL